jgi:iron(III) transport system substrate-binding protein
MTRRFRAAAAAFACIFIGASAARGADQSLIDAAKREGSVTWYTTQIIDQFARPAAAMFEKKYGIRVDYVRANVADIVLRITTEAKAGRVQADVFDGTTTVPGLKREGLVLKYIPESAKRLGSQFIDPEGYWVAGNFYVHTPVYNTDLVKPGTEPHTWADLLDPRWKNVMCWSSIPASSAAPGFIGIVLASMGEDKGMDYLRKLSKQNIVPIAFAGRQVVDQVIAGEYPITLQAFHHQAVISAAQGAPVAWVPIEPAMAVLSVISITKDAPHPNAAKLFEEFLISPEGQILLRDSDYVPVDPQVPARDPRLKPETGHFKATFMTPEQIDAGMPKWMEIFKTLF